MKKKTNMKYSKPRKQKLVPWKDNEHPPGKVSQGDGWRHTSVISREKAESQMLQRWKR